jgi:Methyltransferase domain
VGHHLGLSDRVDLYTLDDANRVQLMSSAPLMWDWSTNACAAKSRGGMEAWAKGQNGNGNGHVRTCDWYHGTWQLLRLLNMVAVPPWYAFYHDALTRFLRAKPDADVLISALADYGMLATLHEAVVAAGASPTITICDICETPLLSAQWYADRHGFEIRCLRDDLLTSPELPVGGFDLVVTDELLTVLPSEDKPRIVARWKEFLRPGGAVVTTAMIGAPTTPELRAGYAERARRLLDEHPDRFEGAGATREELVDRFERFAGYHTRHMLSGEEELRALFAGFDLEFTETVTPGECVNPTSSFQIVASPARGG